jgi:hypothetical protein
MERISEIIHGWLGWCPHARIANSRSRILTIPEVAAQQARPGGGTGGPGRMRMGTGLALGSIRILFRNPGLLWFSLLTGLVMSFSLVTNLYIQYLSGTLAFAEMGIALNQPAMLIANGSPVWYALMLVIGLISTFLTYYLLAGLIACVSSLITGEAIPLRAGISRAADHARPLFCWAGIGALMGVAGTAISGGGSAGFFVILPAMGISMAFFLLTVFVVPIIVLDNAQVMPAIRESVSVFRRTWKEIFACFGVLLLIVFALYLIVFVPVIFLGFSAGSTMSAGFAVVFTMLVMMILIFIGSTVMGIATLGLYAYGMTGKIPRIFEGKPSAKVPA